MGMPQYGGYGAGGAMYNEIDDEFDENLASEEGQKQNGWEIME